MTAIRSFVKRYPVLSYYILVFAISWGGLLVLAGGKIPGDKELVDRLFFPALLLLFAGPSLSGLIMTGLVDGKAGYRDLAARLLRWRVGARWWAVALLFGPLVVTIVQLVLLPFSPEYMPGIVNVTDKLGFLLFGLGWGLVGGGLLEETGWTGFAIPKLRLRHSAFTTGMIVGILWGIWHLLIAFWSSSSLAGENSFAEFVAGFLAFYMVGLPAFRVLIVWVYDRTESLPVAMLMHALLSASTIIMQPIAPGTPYWSWNLVLAVALWVVVAVVALVNRGQTTRPPLRTQIAGHP